MNCRNTIFLYYYRFLRGIICIYSFPIRKRTLIIAQICIRNLDFIIRLCIIRGRNRNRIATTTAFADLVNRKLASLRCINHPLYRHTCLHRRKCVAFVNYFLCKNATLHMLSNSHTHVFSPLQAAFLPPCWQRLPHSTRQIHHCRYTLVHLHRSTRQMHRQALHTTSQSALRRSVSSPSASAHRIFPLR